MVFKISGFGASQKEEKSIAPTYETYQQNIAPRKSLVQIRFSGKGMALTYITFCASKVCANWVGISTLFPPNQRHYFLATHI